MDTKSRDEILEFLKRAIEEYKEPPKIMYQGRMYIKQLPLIRYQGQEFTLQQIIEEIENDTPTGRQLFELMGELYKQIYHSSIETLS